MTPEEFLGESVLGRAVFEAVQETLSSFGDVTVSTTRSQIALKRRRGLTYIWLPGMELARPQAEVVVSIALDRAVATPRFNEIANPSAGIWQHHLEVRSVAEVDDEVRNWLRAAYDCAG
jgi:predicted 2-oxoglutarate/Fe(II)-dependent dioxygenase YbiX